MKYERPTIKEYKPEEITDAIIAEVAAVEAEFYARNRAKYAEAKDALKAASKTITDIFGIGSRESKYVAKLSVPSPSESRRAPGLKNAREVYARDAWKREAAEKEARLKERAVVWLLAKGKTIGEDFTLDNALAVANELAYTEEVERTVAELKESGELVRFDGWNCDDFAVSGCGGWDGYSRRCQCGNRRVGWVEGCGHTFEEPRINGEAY